MNTPALEDVETLNPDLPDPQPLPQTLPQTAQPFAQMLSPTLPSPVPAGAQTDPEIPTLTSEIAATPKHPEQERKQEQAPAREQDTKAADGPTDAIAPPKPPKFDIGSIGTVEELSQVEYTALLTNEQILADEFKNSIDVGLALADIRDRRLYRIEYTSFPEYYRNKWHFDSNKVHYLTATADVHKAITVGTDLPRPDHAFQLRPLLGLALDKARLAWEHAAKKAGGRKITFRLVRAAIVELQLKPEPNAQRIEVRRERAERRQQLTRAMTDLMELIVMRKPYEAMIEKASLLDQHLRFFFPKARKR